MVFEYLQKISTFHFHFQWFFPSQNVSDWKFIHSCLTYVSWIKSRHFFTKWKIKMSDVQVNEEVYCTFHLLHHHHQSYFNAHTANCVFNDHRYKSKRNYCFFLFLSLHSSDSFVRRLSVPKTIVQIHQNCSPQIHFCFMIFRYTMCYIKQRLRSDSQWMQAIVILDFSTLITFSDKSQPRSHTHIEKAIT